MREQLHGSQRYRGMWMRLCKPPSPNHLYRSFLSFSFRLLFFSFSFFLLSASVRVDPTSGELRATRPRYTSFICPVNPLTLGSGGWSRYPGPSHRLYDDYFRVMIGQSRFLRPAWDTAGPEEHGHLAGELYARFIARVCVVGAVEFSGPRCTRRETQHRVSTFVDADLRDPRTCIFFPVAFRLSPAQRFRFGIRVGIGDRDRFTLTGTLRFFLHAKQPEWIAWKLVGELEIF